MGSLDFIESRLVNVDKDDRGICFYFRFDIGAYIKQKLLDSVGELSLVVEKTACNDA